MEKNSLKLRVLNLVISGIPSIQKGGHDIENEIVGFKPCYKWNTFNTVRAVKY